MERLQIDRAVSFGTLQRAWQIGAGTVTALVIAWVFTPELQGFYYTFLSLLALQVFAELGLGQVIIQFAAHEWAQLGLDRDGNPTGDLDAKSRLISLGRFSLCWYAVAALVATVGLSVSGKIFFSKSSNAAIHWLGPWFAVCVLTGAMLLLIPVWSVLEGCNQVSEVYRFRFFESVIYSLALWMSIAAGAGLWAPAFSTAAKLGYNLFFLRRRYPRFLLTFLSNPQGPRIAWWSEVWSLQWRFALSWLSGYFCFSLFTPTAFHFQDATVAGQVGMTWSLVTAVSSVSTVWVYSKVPTFGVLVARRDYATLDRLAIHAALVSLAVAASCAAVLWLGVYVLYLEQFRLGNRLLPPLPTGLFLVATVLMQISFPQSAYLRAHKKEPMLGLSVASAALIGASTWLLDRRFGPVGMAGGYLAVVTLVVLPVGTLILARCRAAWHGPQEPAGPVAEVVGR